MPKSPQIPGINIAGIPCSLEKCVENNNASENLADKRILLVRGRRVMIDADLADLYGVTTKRLNEQVKRNKGRFPSEFMFQLNLEEKDELVANCDQFKNMKHSSSLPYAFTEHGAVMLASVLNSSQAVEISILVVKAFIRLREMLGGHKELAIKLDELERQIQDHDESIQTLFDAIRQLMSPPHSDSRKIGFAVSGNRTPI